MHKLYVKKTICAVLAASLLTAALLTGCSSGQDTTADSASPSSATSAQNAPLVEFDDIAIERDIYHDAEHTVGYQLEKPQAGEQVAILHTSMGDISLRFFPEAAPKAVENFITHAQEGYYDGLTFHRAVEDFVIQGGDPNGNGTGGESIYGTSFEDEFSDKLFNIRGSVAMANSGADTNGSQFFINTPTADDFPGWDYYESAWEAVHQQLSNYIASGALQTFMASINYTGCLDTDLLSDEIKNLYTENGGNPTLDGAFNAIDRGHTVFAQVYDGMDVVDQINTVEVDSNSAPVEAVTIESIEVTTYQE